MTRMVLHGGRLWDPEAAVEREGDVFLADGRIAAIGTAPDGFRPDREMDVTGCYILPGLVDLAARLREPGGGAKADIGSESLAAVAGGITTLVVPPDTQPPIDTGAVVEAIRKRAEAVGAARVLCLGALTKGLAGEILAEMHALGRRGCVGVSNALSPIADTEVLRRAMEYAATCGLTIHYHPEDPWLVSQGFMHEGTVATRLGIPAIPAVAETIALARALLLVELTGARVHFCRLTCARSVELLAEAKARDLPVTADVGIAYLYERDADVGFFDANHHVRPPFRSRADRDALRAGLATGVIDAVCSDHQPHDSDAKTAVFSIAEPGCSLLDTFLPLLLGLREKAGLSGPALARAAAFNPARILGLDVGRLQPGAPADLCLVNPRAEWTLTAEVMKSRGKNSPYLGRTFRGRAVLTLIAGREVFARKP